MYGLKSIPKKKIKVMLKKNFQSYTMIMNYIWQP